MGKGDVKEKKNKKKKKWKNKERIFKELFLREK